MKKVFVGLSGGVDSAVTAALLQRQGYDVTGVFIKIWQPEFIECTWREDRLDVMRVCAALGVPYRELDLSDQYKREVVDSMIADYARGTTPNPDVLCNRAIKFGHFSKWAFAEGADMIATGHYAQIRDERPTRSLMRGRDTTKDQSYFLYQLDQTDLERTIFPIGEMLKKEVRALAKKIGLPNSEKADSQGLCFIGDVTLEDFLARFIELKQGNVVDMSGKVIGKHGGAALYTIGQRHGFTTHSNQVHYVVGIDATVNLIRVSEKREDALRSEAKLRDIHWIDEVSKKSFDADVQARYREKSARAHIDIEKRVVQFVEPHLVSPGQSLVIYNGEQVIGGAMIQ